MSENSARDESEPTQSHEPLIDFSWEQLQLNDAWAGAVVLALLVCTAYLPAFFGGFFWDDEKHITQNPILSSPNALARIWFSLEFQQYLPIQLTSFWAELKLFGQNPLPFHAVNIGLHALNAILVWQVCKRLSLPAAWLIAAVFALHPVNVETVAWITERRNLLAALFCLLAVLAWLKFDADTSIQNSKLKIQNSKSRWRWYAATLAFYLLALLSKTVSSSLPVVLLLIGWMRGKKLREIMHDVVLLLPFFAAGLPLGLLTAWMERSLIGAQGPEWNFSFAERLLICGRALWFYALKDLFPYPLMFEYPRWKLDSADWAQWAWFAATLAMLLSLVPIARRWGRKPAAALLFFGITLFPALGFANVYPQRFSFVADHFQYLASLGIIALVVGYVAHLARNIPALITGSASRMVAASLLVALGIMTWTHARSFLKAETVWQDTLSKNNDAWLAHHNMGVIEFNRGELDKALRHYQQAWRSGPKDIEVLAQLGDSYFRKGQPADARQTFNLALELSPAFNLVHAGPERDEGLVSAFFRAVFHVPPTTRTIYEQKRILATEDVLLGLAWLDAAEKNERAALENFNRAMELRPKSTKPLLARAEYFRQTGKLDVALRDCEKAGEVDGHSAQPLYLKAQILRASGRTAESITVFREALTREPEHIGALADLGAALKDEQQLDEAIALLRHVLRLKTDHAGALYNMGAIMLAQGSLESAGEFFRRAVLAQPGFTDARLNLAVVQAAQGKIAEALGLVERLPLQEISSADSFVNLALIYKKAKAYLATAAVLRKGLDCLKPDAPGIDKLQDQLAWLLATCPDDKVRNGVEALKLASAQIAPGKAGAQALDTFAAALAESGDFKTATATAAQAQALATSEGQVQLSKEIDNRRKLYESSKPFRDTDP